MASGWVDDARDRLVGLRLPSGGWGYEPGSAPGVEPTALACLGLLAADADRGRDPGFARAAAGWVASVQNPDGSVGVSASLAAPGWATPHAVWLWAASGGEPERMRRAADWLVAQQGRILPREPGDVVGHDPTIPGWSWVAETSPWLEPTAMSVLALRRAGRADHPRVREGLRMIRDRAIPEGGWNCGNRSTFGRDLRPQPGSTGLALLALAGLDERSTIVERAMGYLRETLPGVRSAQSLCWGLLGLRAWGERPGPADAGLAETYRRVRGRMASPPRLAYLLLAVGDRSLLMLGVDQSEGLRDG